MKNLLLLSVLVLTPALEEESGLLSTQAAVAAAVPSEEPDARLEQGYGNEHRVKEPAKNYNSNEKRLLTAHGPTNEIEAKRLKLIFLLMLSQGQYRAPIQ